MKRKIEVTKKTSKNASMIIKLCHICGHLNESYVEVKKCSQCNKSYLPINYFHKGFDIYNGSYDDLYLEIKDLDEDDLIRGIHVIW